jgi:hypothetical protein
MKTFEIYMIEEDVLRTYNLKRNDLLLEIFGFDLGIDIGKQGPAYSKEFAGRKNTNPRKIFVSDGDGLFEKFILDAQAKMGTLAVAGALLFLKFSYKSISYIFRSAGKILLKILQYLGIVSTNVLKNLYISLKDYLEKSNDFTAKEKKAIEEKLNQGK